MPPKTSNKKSKSQKTKASKTKDDQESSADEVKFTNPPKGGKPKKEKKSKDPVTTLKDVPQDKVFTPIKENAYKCLVPGKQTSSMNKVAIDTQGIICQLFERMRFSIQNVSNLERAVEYYVRMECALVAVMLQIVKGVLYSDIPSRVVECITRGSVMIHKDDEELVHMCSIPKGRVYIGRGNKSLATLAAFLLKLEREFKSSQTFHAHVRGLGEYLHLKEVKKSLVVPDPGDDACLSEWLKKFEQYDQITCDYLVNDIRRRVHELNAIVDGRDGYVLYQPVVCELNEVAYLKVTSDDNLLMTFNPVSKDEVVKRLQRQAFGVRFYVGFLKVYRETRTLVEPGDLEAEVRDHHMVPILEEYGFTKLTKKMEEDDMNHSTIEFDLAPLEKDDEDVEPQDLVFNKEHIVYKDLVKRRAVVTKGLILASLDQVSAIRVGCDSIVEVSRGPGQVPWVSALVKDLPKDWNVEKDRCFIGGSHRSKTHTKWITTNANGEMEQMVNQLPALK